MPGSKKHRQTDTFVVSLEDAPKLALQTTTKRDGDRTKEMPELSWPSVRIVAFGLDSTLHHDPRYHRSIRDSGAGQGMRSAEQS